MGLKQRAIRWSVAVCAMAAFTANATEHEAVPGEYIVKFKNEVSVHEADTKSLSGLLGSHIKSTIPSFNIVVIQRGAVETTKSVLKSIASNPNVEYVEPNFIYRANRTANDPMLGQLWGLSNPANNGIDVDAVRAWAMETGNPDMVVAVIDTGVDYTHPDLRANAWINQAEANGQPGVDDDGNGVVDDIHGYNAITGSGDPMDDHGHGTHCAGTIGAKGNDGAGIVGVAWDVKLMGAKFLDANGSGTLENAIKAIDYTTKMGARILSNSWGGGGFSQALRDVIQRSHDAGALFVAAAGNEANNNDSNPSYPATYDVPNVLSVAAINSTGRMASFSSFGRTKVHVGAPGVAVTSSVLGGRYATWDGTSMATPHVSGVAALLLSNQPSLTNVEAKDRLINTAKKLAALRNRVSSGGMVNAYNALTNTVPGPDMNDPMNWQTAAASISSPHPYTDKYSETYSVSVPGARQIAVYFEKFQTEANYDTVVVKDARGNVVDKLSGYLDDSFSAIVEGDSATLEFTTDGSVTRYGFDITRIAWR